MKEMFILSISPDSIVNAFRKIFFDIVLALYHLVESAFDLFFDITSYTFMSGEIAKGLFNRIFIIIGAFMLFKLCISFISYLISPDSMQDKEKGIGKLFGRLIMMLVLLYLLMPMESFNLWGTDTEEQKNKNEIYQSNGLLFGVLYDLQERVINEGTIAELILGQNLTIEKGEKDENGNEITNINQKYKIGENISFVIMRAFFNVSDTCSEAEITSENPIETVDDLEQILNKTCGTGSREVYAYEFNGFTALIVALGVAVIVFLFCFDVAIRMIKLGILRLLSPIPAISYIDPKSSREGTFANYVKTLTSTYLDLFLRLAIIYLVIFIIANIAKNDVGMFNTTSENSKLLAKPIIYISLLFFAAQAPKFIMQALGIKSKGTGLGFGASLLGGSLAGAISGYATGGAWGALTGFATGARTGSQNQWARQNGQNPGGSVTQAARDRVAQNNTGNYNAKGRSLTTMIGSRIGNKIKGMDRNDVDRAKGTMYYLEGKSRSAQNDFTNNTDGVMDLPGSSKWKNLAINDKQAVLDATEKVENAKQTLEEMKMIASSGREINAAQFKRAQDALSIAETELTAAQKQQQTDYDAYNNFINAEYGKAKKHYEIGDQNLQRTDERHVYRSRPHVFGSEDKNRYNYNGGNGGRYDKFPDHHPHE